MIDFFIIGEPLYGMASTQEDVDLEHVTEFKRYMAGAEVNVAVGIARLGFKSVYFTQLGNDVFAKYIVEELEKNKIDTKYILYTDEYNTAFQLKSKVSKGDPVFGYLRKKSAGKFIDKNKVDEIDFSSLKLLHLTGLYASLSENTYDIVELIIEKAKKSKIFISFDPNLRPQLWKDEKTMIEKINKLAFSSNLFMPGLSEGKLLSGCETPTDIASFYLDKGVEMVVIKLGPSGAFVKTKDEEYIVDGFIIDKVVDTVGAGDGFAVGVVSGLLNKFSLKESVKRGCAIGALAVTKMGDNEGYPDEEALQIFMKEAKRYKND